MNKLLTLDFLTTKRNQAARDLELYTTLIQELEDLIKSSQKLATSKAFLTVLAGGKGNEADKEN